MFSCLRGPADGGDLAEVTPSPSTHAGDDEKLSSKECTVPDSPSAPILESFDYYPDGGFRAWLVVFGTICTTFATFGFVNTWGVFQAYYETNILPDSSPSDIAWIGSLQYALNFLPGLVTGRIFDLGYFRIQFLIGNSILVVTTFLTAECKEYWQFLLCQGFGIGIGAGITFGPSVALVSHWFKKKRGYALAVMGIGSSLGGTTLPILSRNLINVVGFPWTMRILGFLLLFMLTLANLTMKRRLPAVNVEGGLFNLAAFKSATYSIFCLSMFTSFLGIYTVLTYIDASSVAVGLSPDFAFYLVAIANGSSGTARYLLGSIIDRVGAVNIMAPMSIITAILTMLWPYAHTKSSIIAIAVLYGFSSAAYVTAFTIPIVLMGDIRDVGRRTGMAMSILALGAVVGPPISGAINTASGSYKATGYYAGSMVILSVILMLISRHLFLGRFLGKF